MGRCGDCARVTLKDVRLTPEKPLRHYRVQIREEQPPPQQATAKAEQRNAEHRNGLSTNGIHRRFFSSAKTKQSPQRNPVEPSVVFHGCRSRCGGSRPARSTNPAERRDLVQGGLEGREIAENVARQDIEIVRRVGQPEPGPDRERERIPVLRAPDEAARARSRWATLRPRRSWRSLFRPP